MEITKITIFISLCLAFIFNACNTTKQIDSKELSSLIDTYYYHFGENPSDLESFLAFYNNLDSVNATIIYLTERKTNINWKLNNKSVLEEELVIREKEDTLIWFSRNKHLSFLNDLINGYEQTYLEYPKSLIDLINYDRVTRGMKEESFDRCIVATLEYLEKYNDQLKWQTSDSMFLLTAGTDTITYRIGLSYGLSICESDYWKDKVLFLFYDNEGTVVFNEELLISFKKGLQEIRKTFQDECFDNADYHILQYTTDKGLQRFCANDTLSLNTEWFKDVDTYLRQFTINHELGKVIFVSVPFSKKLNGILQGG